MKFNDNITLDIAKTVSDVLEGKKKKLYGQKVKEQEYDAKKDHDMDPTSHVVKNKETGMYDVFNMSNKKVKSFEDKAEADKYAKDNHDSLMKKESPEEPRAQGEKEFKAKHIIKKSGMRPDGTNMKEAKEEETPTGPAKEESEKQKAYQKVFQAALKKYGVKSPAELKDSDKKKEFFDYVDKNYEADNESVKKEAVKEAVVKEEPAPPAFVKKYSTMRMMIKDIQAKIEKEDEKHPFEKDDDKIDAMRDKIADIRDSMKKMVDKFGQGVTKGGDFERGGN